MYQHWYTRFLEHNKGKQHFACHSHHYWPDVTRQAMLDYWDDSARLVDDKWDYFFSNKIPHVQKMIAQHLKLSHPQQIVFAPNTHEFVYRLLSCLPPQKPLKILTTDSEFHSFERQMNRFAERENVQVTKISTQPFETFEERFIQAISVHQEWDLFFLSQVFFNSGVVLSNLKKIVSAVTNPHTLIVLDGYHGFMAVPTDLSPIQDRVFYLAGSYKYAQGGEGCCFLYVPPSFNLRPEFTGWFATLAQLPQTKNESVQYPQNAMSFAGSTMDFAALYRLSSVLDLFAQNKLGVMGIHQYVQGMQKIFLEKVKSQNHPLINEKNLLAHDLNNHGHFFTYETPSAEEAKHCFEFLKSHQIITDYRGKRLRFGFGLYHDGQYDLTCLC